MFGGWQRELASTRKYAPSARNYTACRLSSLIGPRVSELCLLRMGDLRWELGTFGKILLRGKGSHGRGKKERLVPLINGARELLDWWVSGPRWTFDDHANDPLAPVFPSERRNVDGSSSAVTTDALRDGLAAAVRHAPTAHRGQLSPHLLRHFAASDLYRNGMDIVAIQEVLGHRWFNTTMIYVHVDRTHIEQAWAARRPPGRRTLGGPITMKWNLRLVAAQRDIWKPPSCRHMLADAGLVISAGKMSHLWAGQPVTIRLEDLEIICSVLRCSPNDLLVAEQRGASGAAPSDPAQSAAAGEYPHPASSGRATGATGVNAGPVARARIHGGCAAASTAWPGESCGVRAVRRASTSPDEPGWDVPHLRTRDSSS